MDRVIIFATLIVGVVFAGGLVAALLRFGWYSWLAFDGAAAIGFTLTRPTSYAISRRIKQQDPNWDATKVDGTENAIPGPAAPVA
ncbi:hypothetical protein [Cypionkella sp. TWP1-2-1b2]|uniref:hypothetical protein n=1 Tax=Cypionkella sp. TWP1-2-1b2 TaxID=2804675 RepID=UPI003CEFA66B